MDSMYSNKRDAEWLGIPCNQLPSPVTFCFGEGNQSIDHTSLDQLVHSLRYVRLFVLREGRDYGQGR